MWSIRQTPERVEKIRTIAAYILEDPAHVTSIIDYALNHTIATHATRQPRQDTPGLSMVQALTLADIAEDIAGKTYTGTQPTDAERLQLYEQLTPMPAWYTDEHRRTCMELIKKYQREATP